MDRRYFLSGAGALAAAVLAKPPSAGAQALSDGVAATLRGSIPATDYGVRPDALDDQSASFTRMLEIASASNAPIFLPPGSYIVSNILLPSRLRLTGIPGRSRILYGGGGRCLYALDGEDIALSGVVVDGATRILSGEATGLVDLRGIAKAVIEECDIVGSAGNGLALERSGGRIERSTITDAADAGIYCVQSTGMRIAGNTVRDCGNGGILVHRWKAGRDGTLVTENRVERIAARNGGTGQYGNGINLYRADNVIVADNHVADCAFSAIRANSASNVQINSNNCTGSGETAIYSEFAFQGAIISANVVDGAANGISMVNFDKGGRMAVCNGNIVRNLSRSGPYAANPPGFGVGINVEADSIVSANVIEDAPVFGMAIGWGPFMRNVVATGNVIRKSGTGIAVSVVEGAGAAVISNNIIQDSANGAIVGYRWAEATTGDLTTNGAKAFANITIEGNRTG